MLSKKKNGVIVLIRLILMIIKMEKILLYIKRYWLILTFGFFFLGWYLYLSYTGNQFCDCQKTEKYQEGSSRTSGGRTLYRYYHK